MARLCYHTLRMVITGNKKSVPRVMDAEGVDTMVKHKIKKGVPAYLAAEEWDPPIHAVIATNIERVKAAAGGGGGGGGSEGVGDEDEGVGISAARTHIVHKTDILFLLDKCFEKITAGGLGDADLYFFLADVCELSENNPELAVRFILNFILHLPGVHLFEVVRVCAHSELVCSCMLVCVLECSSVRMRVRACVLECSNAVARRCVRREKSGM